MKASTTSRIKAILFRVAVFSLLAGVVAPAYAQVSPRGVVTETSPGRVLQAQQTSNCFAPTLKVTPSEVDKSGSLKFEVNVKNTCTTKQTAYVKVLYSDTLLLRNVTPGGAFGTPPAELSGGASKDYTFDVAVGGIQGLTKTTNFHAQVTMSRSPDAKSEPVPVVMKFITDENPVGSANCLLLNLIVAPTVIKAKSETLAFGLKLNNNCTGGIGPQLAVLYNKDQPINPIANPPWLAPGASDQVNFSWGVGGLQGLTGTTNFYAVAKYTDPATKKEVSVRSNIVAVSMEFSGVTPGDGGTGTGEGATLPPGAQSPTAGGATSCISITSGPICVINYVIAAVVSVFNNIVKFVLLRFLGPFIEALVSIRTYTDDFAQVIYSAWQILRNLGNIFFILSIVAIGVATVFRISGYAVKDLLVKLIVGAILINFSLTIAQAILGIADTVTNQFLGPNTGAIRAIVNPLVSTDIWANVTANAGDFSSSIQGVFSFWLSFAAFIAFLGVAFLLFFRIIMLWILLMLSPLPYVAMVLPVTRKMSKTWWSKFIQWAFNAPIVAFMLNLTATVTVANSNIIQKLANVQTGNSSEVTTFMFAVAGQAIPIAFLFMTVKAGASVGKGAAGFIDKAIDKGAKAAFLPAALTGAAIGAGAAAVGGAVANTAKNVAAVPVDLAKLKFAEKRAGRLAAIDEGTAGIGTKAVSFLAGDKGIGKILAAKRKRYAEDTKHYQHSNEATLAYLEKEKSLLGWKGAKVFGNRIKSKIDTRSVTFGSAKEKLESAAQLKTNDEIAKDLKAEGYEGHVNEIDLRAALAEARAVEKDENADKSIKDQSKKLGDKLEGALKNIESRADSRTVRDQLQPELPDDIKKKLSDQNFKGADLQTQASVVEALKSTNLKLADKNISGTRKTELEAQRDALLAAANHYAGSTVTTKAIQSAREAAKKQLAKSEFTPSFMEDKHRRENTKAAASRLPSEYSIGEYADFFQKAVAKGDKYGALQAWQTIEQEGDIKTFLEQMKYKTDTEGLKKFVKDYFGGEGKEGFDMGHSVNTLLRESDKRVKAGGDWDLAGKIKYDAEKGKFTEEGPARVGKNIAKRIGEGSITNLWSNLTTKVATVTNENGVVDVSETFLEGLGQLNMDDPQQLKAFDQRLNTPTAKNITTTSGPLKTEADVDRVKGKIITHLVDTAVAKAKKQGVDLSSEAEKTILKQKAENVYMLIQHSSGETFENSPNIRKVVKRVNEEDAKIRGVGKYKDDDDPAPITP